MLRLMVSAGMLAALAVATASRRRGLAERSPPPWRAATMISRMTRVHTLPRFSSWRPLRCWMFAHLLCPATKFFLALLLYPTGGTTFYFLHHGRTPPRRQERRHRSPLAARTGQPPRPDHGGHGDRQDRDLAD